MANQRKKGVTRITLTISDEMLERIEAEAISINHRPTNTGNPVADFDKAIMAQEGGLSLGRFYRFDSILVRFYLRAGKMGMDHFRPVHERPNLFTQTRITTSGERKNMGRTSLEA